VTTAKVKAKKVQTPTKKGNPQCPPTPIPHAHVNPLERPDEMSLSARADAL